ncbi:MAG: hypothetical protein P1P82_05545 [Bacteroidales bacterium]|nr:hypothetical protein [Bacteroidales bacterium]
MKNIVKISMLLVLGFAWSCESYFPAEPDLTNTYPAYVEIENTAPKTVPEGSEISLTLTSRSVVYQSYTVSYEVTGDYSTSGTVEVPEAMNRYTVSVPVEAGIVTDDPLSATVTLTDVTGDMALGRNGMNTAVEVSITKFVPYDADDYAITFNCVEPGSGEYQCTFVKTDDPLVLTNSNFKDSLWHVAYTFSGDFDQVITIDQQTVGDEPDVYSVSGSGTYDGVLRTMVVDYTVVDVSGNVLDDNTHTFTVPE